MGKARILITMDDINYHGGAHFATFNIANYLTKSGYDVDIYSPNPANKDVNDKLEAKVHVLNKKNFEGYDYIVVPFENSMFREEVAALACPVKIQWVHIDYALWKDIVGLDLNNERKLYSSFDHIIFVSNQIRDGFLTVFPEFEYKCKTIYNLLDVDEVRKKAEQFTDLDCMNKKSPEQLNIVLSGRLETQKAYHRMIDAALLLKRRGCQIEWFILGEGYEYEALKKRCIKHDLANIHFLGFRKNPYPYIKAADIFALLSFYEGYGLVVAESNILGTPVLVTESGGTSESLDKCGGWLIKNSLSGIVDAISDIYENRNKIVEVSEKIKKLHFDSSESENSLNALFAKAPNKEPKKIICPPANKQDGSEIIKVSIIVPVYNMEAFLEECLQSLVSQTLKEIEIIIVNDGSTDKSQLIIDNFVYKHPDIIRAFTIPNGGLGMARNYGISKARGQFLGFIDSDDACRADMYEIMYKAAKENNADYLFSDYIATWPDGRSEYVTSVIGDCTDRFDFLRYSAKYGVVNACTKLIDRRLFERIQFAKGFYEDLATLPIIMSYADNVHYVREGLYYYRQRSGSITSVKSNDKRLLACYDAWDRMLRESNPLFKKEISYAVYWSINFFCTGFLDDFTGYSLAYYRNNREAFLGNSYIEDSIRKKEFIDFENIEEIPKIIHFCWFGHGEKSELIHSCIRSWKTFAPDFEIMEWNEANCNIHENKYVEEAYQEKKYAYVSDYFRLKAMYEYGGVYLDTDMELMKPLNPYLYNKAFFAFETPIFVHAGIIGAIPKMDLLETLLKSYENEEFSMADGEKMKTIPRRITEYLEKDPLFIKNGKTQVISENIKIYSANMMTMNFHDGKCIANHHYAGSWMKQNAIAGDFGYEVLRNYFTWDLYNQLRALEQQAANGTSISYPSTGIVPAQSSISDIISQRDYYKSEFERLENSTSWKLTAPLRAIADFFKKLFGRNKQ